MAQRPEGPDIALAQKFFADRGSVAERIPKAAGKTPDLKILRASTGVAFCDEVKSPQDVFPDRLKDAILQRPKGQIGGVVRSGTASRQYLRMEDQAKTAVDQFSAVNPSHALPNILIFVNHDTTSREGDFEEVVTGYFNGIRTSSKTLRDEIPEIDAYVWLTANNSKPLMFWQQNGFRDLIIDLLKA
jgi:hypothetical protein